MKCKRQFKKTNSYKPVLQIISPKDSFTLLVEKHGQHCSHIDADCMNIFLRFSRKKRQITATQYGWVNASRR